MSHIVPHKSCYEVCGQTCTDLIIPDIESGSAKSIIKKWQQTFLRKRSACDDYEQSLIHQAIHLAKASKC